MEAYVMDAFSTRLFGGNQAGVALPEHPLDDGVMQQIAAEFKHSETAFAAVEPDGSVTLRYFTPAGEVELCGHATIAAFALLRALGRIGDGTVTAASFWTACSRVSWSRTGIMISARPVETMAGSNPSGQSAGVRP